MVKKGKKDMDRALPDHLRILKVDRQSVAAYGLPLRGGQRIVSLAHGQTCTKLESARCD